MLDELKTLKDLDCTHSAICDTDDPCTCEDGFEVLKEEAIKWIKAIINNKTTYGMYDRDPETSELVDWIKYFFNLTVEDLK